ncbi:MAG: DNA internalization-related competence protein ComEC/Rec2 [Caldilinea sp. CFX5]|nr:DNA internalization-related competence protein ComEC/Rec2 [Caldilinea sp. CFX5]
MFKAIANLVAEADQFVTLLYLTIAYLLGLALGHFLWVINSGGCQLPGRLWWLPLGLLLLTPWLHRLPLFQPKAVAPLRWPVRAGFPVPRTGPSPVLLLALALCLLLGFLRYAAQPLTPCWTPADLAYYNLPADRAFDRAAPTVTISGYVSSYPLVADAKQRLQVVATTITIAGVERVVAGELRLNTGVRQRYDYGQPVRVQGRLVTPPEFTDFSYRDYLARKGIHSLLYGARIETLAGPPTGHPLLRTLYAFRARGERLLNRLLPEPYAALANGMLLGIEAGIPDTLYEQFNLTGVSHTIVISGSNISILAALLLALGQRLLGRRRALWPTLCGIGAYALLVGGDAAVSRAALMGGLFVTATAIGRRSTALVSLAAACWVITLVNPLTLWDVGFQLSSAATAGLILFMPDLTARFEQWWTPKAKGNAALTITQQLMSFLRTLAEDGLLVTIAANITTLPLVIYYFQRLSAVSLLTNFAVAPVQPYIMLWGTLGVVAGALGLTWLAWLLLLLPWLSLVWTVAVVQWTAALPGASLEIANYDLTSLLLTYGVIALCYWRSALSASLQGGKVWVRTTALPRLVSWGAAALLAVGALLLWAALLTQPDGRLHVYFLDIGQGDGILIQTPSGRQVLIDGGASPQRLFSELGAVMPFWDRSLDLLLMTHPDLDHIGAQTFVPDRFSVTTALATAVGVAHPDAAQWRQQMDANGVTIQQQAQGGWLELGDGVALWLLWPTAKGYQGENGDNENSLVAKLVYGDFHLLLTGDAGLPAETGLLTAGEPIDATVLKVGHHGSKGSSSAAFVNAVNPQIAVIQVGAENDYGHPHQEILDRLAGRLILRNDQQGRIHLASDGQRLWLTYEKEK